MVSIITNPLLSFTPLIQTSDHNLVRISRTHTPSDDLYLVAGGQHRGILINKLTNEYEDLKNCLHSCFSVWLGNGQNFRQEIRSFKFSFEETVNSAEQSSVSQLFIKELLTQFPKDYASFFKLILKLMQNGFEKLRSIDVDMKFALEEEAMPMPNLKEYGNDAEIENVNMWHIQDVLEHAYPNGLSVEIIADSLRCTSEEVEKFLEELERTGIASRAPNQQDQWIRLDNFSIPESQHQAQSKHHPTVAIITCLFVEKQCIDSIIENSSTMHKYSKAGDSNVYTIGYIGEHRVVSTKLALIGDTREAITSAGSITTRLLGSFQHVEHVIIVGVGGGVPHYTDAQLHVRLGDVVVSSNSGQSAAYVYADNLKVDRKTGHIGFSTHDWNPKDNIMAKTVMNRDQVFFEEWRQTTKDLINQLNETVKGNEGDFARPSNELDVLTMQISPDKVIVMSHPNAKRVTSEIHCGPIGAMISLISHQAKQELTENIPPKDNGSTTTKNANEVGDKTTNGENGSQDESNWLNVNAQLKDKFAADFQLKAIDGGFNSVIEAIHGSRIDSWVLIRGIADYQQGQSRLGRIWQPYSSANAASLVKTILRRIPTS